MTLKVRRLLSLIFILLFLAITPAIMLYAAGYKLGRNGFPIERTGMFIIDSEPEGAKIFLDGKARESWINNLFNKKEILTTPAKIKNLLPGEYDLSLELDGYHGWQKKLTINPGASTFAENIFLFKNDLPTEIMPGEIKAISLSPDKNQALILTADKLRLVNLADESEKIINQSALKGKVVAWSKAQDKLVIDNWLYNANDLKTEIDLAKLTPGSFNYKWSDNILYYQDKNSIYRLNHANEPEKIIGNKKFSDFLVKGDYLYLAGGAGQPGGLEIVELASARPFNNIALPLEANYAFINQEQPLINLYDNNREILYLVDPLNAFSPVVETINNLTVAAWVDGNNLVYANDFEIWRYDLETRKKTLTTRISDVISGVAMHPNKNHIIYSTERTINAVELDEREKRNITELVKFDAINTMILSSAGDTLYFSGRTGNLEGLYKFLIQ